MLPVDVFSHDKLEVDQVELISRDQGRDGILRAQVTGHHLCAFQYKLWDVVFVGNLESSLVAKALK